MGGIRVGRKTALEMETGATEWSVGTEDRLLGAEQ